jgi:hypothetical protein
MRLATPYVSMEGREEAFEIQTSSLLVVVVISS